MRILHFNVSVYPLGLDVDQVNFFDRNGNVVDPKVIDSLSTEELNDKLLSSEYRIDANQLISLDEIRVEDEPE